MPAPPPLAFPLFCLGGHDVEMVAIAD